MLHWPKKSLVMPFYYINFDQNGPPCAFKGVRLSDHLKFDLISVIFRLHGLSTVFRNFLKNVKTLQPETYITILSIS